MVIILGASGYVGNAFCRMFDAQSLTYQPVSRKEINYTCADTLYNFLKECRPNFLINCAGYTGKPNVDACEMHKAECLAGNAVLPGTIRKACERLDLAWGHVSSGCIFTGAHRDGSGFCETDPPNFSFRTDNCSFYSGTKALGEEVLADSPKTYVWRLRIPFDNQDSPRNYLAKLINYKCLLQARNSISHLDEFVRACWHTWAVGADCGIYNVTNPGAVDTRQVVGLIKKHLLPDRQFKFFETEEEFMNVAAKTPRSNCVLDPTRILDTGAQLSTAVDAIETSLRDWVRA
ncbi:MAG: sugar nucleotide-binding protein [Planctomycetota bacterium]|nr:sugar nucleotide-binding protein [Planctomycetota bacterium]